MKQSQLNRAVAHATGESLRTIVGRGFSIELPVETLSAEDIPDGRPHVLDWDEIDAERCRTAA